MLTDSSQAGDAPSGSQLPSHHLSPPSEGAVEAHCPSFPTEAVKIPPAGPVEDGPPDTLSPGSSPSGEAEEEQQEQKEQKLLYCSLCKVAVNSLSQLEAHNKGQSQSHTGHTTSPATHSHTPLQLSPGEDLRSSPDSATVRLSREPPQPEQIINFKLKDKTWLNKGTKKT